MMKRIFVASKSRRSAKAAFPASRQSGFTIVEVMLSLVLLAIGAALSLPSYREMVEKRQITHGAEQIMSFVNAAQGEASKQNRVVTVSYSLTANDDWCVGATLGPTKCDCTETLYTETDFCTFETTPTVNSAPHVITNEFAGNAELVKSITSAGDSAYAIDPIRGIACGIDSVGDCVDGNGVLVVEMRSNNEAYRLDLTVSRAGQVILCSNDSSHTVPGYKVCPVVEG